RSRKLRCSLVESNRHAPIDSCDTSMDAQVRASCLSPSALNGNEAEIIVGQSQAVDHAQCQRAFHIDIASGRFSQQTTQIDHGIGRCNESQILAAQELLVFAAQTAEIEQIVAAAEVGDHDVKLQCGIVVHVVDHERVLAAAALYDHPLTVGRADNDGVVS